MKRSWSNRTTHELPNPFGITNSVNIDDYLWEQVINGENTSFEYTVSSDDDDEEPDSLVIRDSKLSEIVDHIDLTDDSNDASNVVGVVAIPSNQPTTNLQISGSPSHSIPPKKKQRASSIEDDILLTADYCLYNMKRSQDYKRKNEQMIRNASLLQEEIKKNRVVSTIQSAEANKQSLESGSGGGGVLAMGTCPVCLESLATRPKAVTMCGHVFCKNCINHVARTLKKCPTCRKALTIKKVHDLFV